MIGRRLLCLLSPGILDKMLMRRVGRWYSSLSPSELFSQESRTRFVEKAGQIKRIRLHTRGDPTDGTNRAAVLVPLLNLDGRPSLLFTARSTQLRSHAGEISYPGGKFDLLHDKSLEDAALRETEEELGISRKSFQVWTELPPLPARDKKTSVTPVVALHQGHFDRSSLRVNPGEVSEVFIIAIEELCNRENQGYTQFRSGYTMPVFFSQQVWAKPRIWGLTAIITHQVLSALAPDSYKLKPRIVPNVMKAAERKI